MSATDGSWLIAAIEGAQTSSGTGRSDPGWFHPSALGNECDAFLAFRYLGAPAIESIEARTRRIFDYGDYREGYLQKYTAAAGISLIQKPEDRLIVIPHLHIRGELDNWVENQVTKKRYVIDYKTMRSGLWKELTEVTRGHRLQLHPYQYAKETYEGFVVYENKDTQELKSPKSNFDGNIWKNDIVDRIEKILSRLEQNVVNRNPIKCSSCPFFANGVCASNKIAELKESSGLYD
jgi:CRISPR/Cas system-associated exonuclease Cas4 (RecB family)